VAGRLRQNPTFVPVVTARPCREPLPDNGFAVLICVEDGSSERDPLWCTEPEFEKSRLVVLDVGGEDRAEPGEGGENQARKTRPAQRASQKPRKLLVGCAGTAYRAA
jgi:hypothetical protein